VSVRDDSHDLPALRERLVVARTRLARLPVSKHRDVGPTDPQTGESWHRGNVLGHVNEMLPFWTDQIQRAVAGSGNVGRDQAGTMHRRQGIDQGDPAAEAELRLAIDEGIGGAFELLNVMSPEDLERTVAYHSREGDREARLGELLQTLVVVHLEDHIEQLTSLD
jgi:hypothetical protein